MQSEIAALEAKLSDKNWRLENLYQIRDKDGQIIPFNPNPEQKRYFKNRHNRNFVPKARKLGMSTGIVIDYLDTCLFPPVGEDGKPVQVEVGHVDLREPDAFKKLAMAKLAWDKGPAHKKPEIAQLWNLIHESNPMVRSSDGLLSWSNGCRQEAGVSFTGTTPLRLHMSEYGPISARFPGKATELKRGAMNAVPSTGIIDIETTMEGGQFGECYKIFKLAQSCEGKPLSRLDWKLHFYPWWTHEDYQLEGLEPTVGAILDYFAKIEKDHGIKLSPARMAWYEKIAALNGEEVYQQFPTTVEEVDRQIVPGQIFPQMKTVRHEGRVTAFNPDRGYPIFTSWDLGSSDNSAGWVIQPAGKAHNILDWCCGEGVGAAGVAEVIREWESRHGALAGHFIPHDAEITDKGSGKTFVAQLVECGIPREKITVVPRIPDKWVGIEEVRRILPNCWFHVRADQPVKSGLDAAELPGGVGRLEGYRKKLDRSTNILADVIVKDICDHTADALRTYAEALSRDLVVANVPDRREKVTVLSGYRGR